MSRKSQIENEPTAPKTQDDNEPKAETKPEKKGYVEKYYRVKFAHQASANDNRDVELSVNGECLVIKRMEEVIIPERYKEVAEHATYQTFRQMPGEERKITGHVNVYPFHLIGEATKAEYQEMLASGNRLARTRDTMQTA